MNQSASARSRISQSSPQTRPSSATRCTREAEAGRHPASMTVPPAWEGNGRRLWRVRCGYHHATAGGVAHSPFAATIIPGGAFRRDSAPLLDDTGCRRHGPSARSLDRARRGRSPAFDGGGRRSLAEPGLGIRLGRSSRLPCTPGCVTITPTVAGMLGPPNICVKQRVYRMKRERSA